MAFFDRFRDKEEARSADIARDRLKVIVSHERRQRNAPAYLPALQRDILAVIEKYVPVEPDQVQVELNDDGSHSVLEVNVNLPK